MEAGDRTETAAFYLTEILLVRRTSHLPSEDGLRSEMADMSAAHDTCTGQSLSTESAFGAAAGAAARRVRSPSVMAVGRRAPSICPHLDRGSRRPDGAYEERAVDKERCR